MSSSTAYKSLKDSPINAVIQSREDTESKQLSSVEDHKSILNEEPIDVGLRFRLDQVASVDTLNECYTIVGYLDMDWKATETDIKTWQQSYSNYKPEYVPNVKPVNCVSIGISPVDWSSTNPICVTSVNNNEYNVLRVQLSCTFREPMNLHNFPFDVQDLTFIFEGVELDYPIKLVPSRIDPNNFFKFEATYSSIHDWAIENQDVIEIGQRLCFRLQISRNAAVICVRFAFWIFLLGVLGFNCFAIDPRAVDSRLAYVMYVVLSIVAQQITLNSSLPYVLYFTIIDKYNYYIFITVVIIAFECVFVGYYDIEDKFNVHIDTTDQYFSLAIIAWFIIGHIGFAIAIYFAKKFEKSKIGKTKEELHRLMQSKGYWKYKKGYRHKDEFIFTANNYHENKSKKNSYI